MTCEEMAQDSLHCSSCAFFLPSTSHYIYCLSFYIVQILLIVLGYFSGPSLSFIQTYLSVIYLSGHSLHSILWLFLFILFFILIILQLGLSLQDLTSNFRSYFVLFSYILDYLCHYIISGRTTLYLRLIIQVIIFIFIEFTFRIFDFIFVIRELGSYCWVFIFPLALYRLIFIIPGSCCWFLLEYTIIIFWLLVVALFLIPVPFSLPLHYNSGISSFCFYSSWLSLLSFVYSLFQAYFQGVIELLSESCLSLQNSVHSK